MYSQMPYSPVDLRGREWTWRTWGWTSWTKWTSDNPTSIMSKLSIQVHDIPHTSFPQGQA